jgi:hypothetical protein
MVFVWASDDGQSSATVIEAEEVVDADIQVVAGVAAGVEVAIHPVAAVLPVDTADTTASSVLAAAVVILGDSPTDPAAPSLSS